ncbi:MAG: ferredoxin [Planctomycetota bacterium]
MDIKKIWIEEGCIACNLCEDIVPEIFEVPPGDDCRVRKGYLKLLGDPAMVERADEAAESCPVEVIIVERG